MFKPDQIDKKEQIDAALEIDHRDQNRTTTPKDTEGSKENVDDVIKGERGSPNLGKQHSALPPGSKTFLSIIFICAIAIGGVFMWKAWSVRHALQNTSTSDNNRTISNHLPHLTLKDPIHNAPSFELNEEHEEINDNEVSRVEVDEPGAQKTSLKRRLSSGLIGKDKNRETNSNVVHESNYELESQRRHQQESFQGSEGDLQSRLKPLRLNPSAAGVLGDRDYLLTQGAMIDCQLETRLITTQPGMTSCYVTRNIYSANGRVVLIDRGSKVVGHYQGGIVQGQASIFVLWSRVETPKGVIINLDSPGTDSLGESGMSGYIDTHFWKRFGGAIMMSFIGDLGDFAARQGRQNKGNTIQFNNTSQGMQDAAVEALKNSINIPPTLYKNQGERISIFVARDLDFEGVYGLESK